MTGEQQKAALALLREAPRECSDRAPLPGRCGRCWTCRIRLFLQVVAHEDRMRKGGR